MRWYNIEERKPQDGEEVIGYRTFQGDKRIEVVYFIQGISQKERELLKEQNNPRANIVRFGDEWGNNHVPWMWDAHGPGHYFGQEIKWWCPLSEFPFPE